MGDISDYSSIINNAARGEDVRDAIVSALNIVANSAENAKKLGGKTSDYYAKYSELKPFAYDNKPTEGSTSLVRGSGIYTFFGDGKNPSSASSDSVAGLIYRLHENTIKIAEAINNKKVDWAIGRPITEYGNAIRKIYKYKFTSKTINKNGTYEAPEGTLWNKVTVKVKPTTDIPLHATENDVYRAELGYSYSPVTVNVKMGTAFEYHKAKKTAKLGVLFYDGGATASETTTKYDDLLKDGLSLEEIYKTLIGSKASTSAIFENMLKSGFDINSIVSVFTSNGNTPEYVTALLKNFGINSTSIFDGLFGSISETKGINEIISSMDLGGKFNVETIANSIKSSTVVGNSTEVLEQIKTVLETEPTEFSTFSSEDLLKLLE